MLFKKSSKIRIPVIFFGVAERFVSDIVKEDGVDIASFLPLNSELFNKCVKDKYKLVYASGVQDKEETVQIIATIFYKWIKKDFEDYLTLMNIDLKEGQLNTRYWEDFFQKDSTQKIFEEFSQNVCMVKAEFDAIGVASMFRMFNNLEPLDNQYENPSEKEMYEDYIKSFKLVEKLKDKSK